MKFKRFLAGAAASALIMTTGTFKTENTVEASQLNNTSDMEIYGDVLDMFCSNISENWTNFTEEKSYGPDLSNKMFISYVWNIPYGIPNSLACTGFQFIDLNNDGINELVVGIINNSEDAVYRIAYDLYTVYNGEVCHLISTGERGTFRINSDDTVKYGGSNGAYSSSTTIYNISDGILVPVENFEADYSANSPFTYSTDWTTAKSSYDESLYYEFYNRQTLSEDTYCSRINSRSAKTLNFTLFSEYSAYKNNRDIIKGDISGNEVLDLQDVIIISKNLVGNVNLLSEQIKLADYNSDEKVDLQDAIGVAKNLLKR